MSTLKQIAIAAGVHHTTAAAVLNGAGGNTRVGEATRKRVTRAAQRLGYIRNESARRLRTGKSNAVAFIGGDLRNPFFAELVSALERELGRHNFQLVISHVSAISSATFSRTIELLRQQTISKIIYWDESASRPCPEPQPQMQLLPIGFTTSPRPGIWLDLGHAIRLAVTYLAGKGYRRIGFYAPRGRQESPSVSIRKRMLMDECGRQGLPAPVCITYQGESWNVEAAVKGGKALAEMNDIGAFIGFNDVAALGLLQTVGASHRKALVVCFDGTPLTRSWPGPPPFLDLRISELARQAVAVAVGERDGAVGECRGNWIRPTLFG